MKPSSRTLLLLFIPLLISFSFDTKQTILDRFKPPSGFLRANYNERSFAYYLQHLKLLPVGTEVKLYDGKLKYNKVHAAVIDISVGNKDLQQCADAVMRLRAEYLFEQKLYDQIHFNLTNGFNAKYDKWMQGQRIVVNGNKSYWLKSAKTDNSHANFMKYMEIVFNYAGTLSLSKELQSIDIKDAEIGDVFIKGGSPGHAVIVVDMCLHETTKQKMIMLAQSYMPAQNIHVLKNFENNSPWFKVDPKKKIFETPEWDFSSSDVKRFN
jgi:hypothetical protein